MNTQQTPDLQPATPAQAHSPLPVYKKRLANGLELTTAMDLERQRDEALADAQRLADARDQLLVALKETTDALYNETTGKDDTPWIAGVKSRAVNVYADCKALAQLEGGKQ